MELECLLHDPSVLALRGVFRVGGTYHLNLKATAPVAACPGCGARSARVHSRCARRADCLEVLYRVLGEHWTLIYPFLGSCDLEARAHAPRSGVLGNVLRNASLRVLGGVSPTPSTT